MRSFTRNTSRIAYLFGVYALAVGWCVFMSPAHLLAQDKYATAAELKLMEGFPPPPDKRITRANALLTPPFNRWSYLHMRMIYPSAPIASADKAIGIDKKIANGIDEVKVKDPHSGSMTDMATFMKKTYTDALVVIHGNQITYEKFFNGMHPDQPHQMMSVTKSFGGLLGMMAVEEGKLKERDLITQYVPELKNKRGRLPMRPSVRSSI